MPQRAQGVHGLAGVEGPGPQGVQNRPFGSGGVDPKTGHAGRQGAFHCVVAVEGEAAKAGRIRVPPGPCFEQRVPQGGEAVGAFGDVVSPQGTAQDIAQGPPDGFHQAGIGDHAPVGDPPRGLGEVDLHRAKPVVGSAEMTGADLFRVDGQVPQVLAGGVSAGVQEAPDAPVLDVAGEWAHLYPGKEHLRPFEDEELVADLAQLIDVGPGFADAIGPSLEPGSGGVGAPVDEVVDAATGRARPAAVLAKDPQRGPGADSGVCHRITCTGSRRQRAPIGRRELRLRYHPALRACAR